MVDGRLFTTKNALVSASENQKKNLTLLPAFLANVKLIKNIG
jgi:hypothetical protein